MAATAASAETPVKIGVLNDRSGLYADLSGEGSVVAAKLAIEDFKAAEKGLKVDVVSADHQNKPDVAINTGREWFDQQGVDHHHRRAELRRGACAQRTGQGKEQGLHQFRRGGLGPDWREMLAEHHPLDLRHLGARERNRQRDREARGNDAGSSSPQTTPSALPLSAIPRKVVKDSGGTVVGSVKAPLNTQDFSSFLLQAQSSGAKIIGLANAGGDTINSIKQAAEFGIVQGGQNLAGLLIFITDIHSLGLKTAQGLIFTAAFYWDLNDQTRAWSDRFMKATGGGQAWSKPGFIPAFCIT